jgi:crotonobetainyl-CoA:carnitine CoA-transferase CaiB-like acyl-CoA transferase
MQVVQAMSGVGTIAQDSNGGPSNFHNLLMDKVTALNAAQSVTAALLARERGLGGQHVQLSMIGEGLLSLFTRCGFLTSLHTQPRTGAAHNQDSNSHACEADGCRALADSAVHFLFPDAYYNHVWRDAVSRPSMEWVESAKASEYATQDGKVAVTAKGLAPSIDR